MGNEIVPYQQKVNNVHALLARAAPQISRALPRHMTADRMARIVMTSCQKTPALLDCDPRSLIGAVIQASQLGLEPDGILGHAYLVPFGNQVQLIPGYRGIVDLARRSGQLLSIHARVVYQRDEFRVVYGDEERIDHVKYLDGDPGPMVAVYMIAHLTNGERQREVMTRAEVDKIRARSRAGNSGPWVTDYEEMARKTVVKRGGKLLPTSVELAEALRLDVQAEEPGGQNLTAVVPWDGEDGEEPPPPATTAAELVPGANRGKAKGKGTDGPAAACDGKHAPTRSGCGAHDCRRIVADELGSNG